MQGTPFILRIEISNSRRSVVGTHGLADTAVSCAGYVASGKMQKSGMVRLADEFRDVHCGVDVGGQGIPQIGIEISQARTIDDEVEIFLHRLSDVRRQTQTGLA